MLPLKKILFPTDFSEPSYKALKVANELALEFSAEMTVLHVIHPFPAVPAGPVPAYNFADVLREMEASATTSLQEVSRERIPETIKREIVVVHGNPAGEIARIAADRKVDVIVIATHGLTGWRRLVFGSVAERVVREARRPVLTVPGPEEEK